MSLSFLDRERTVAPRGYNRWLIPPAALAVHLSIGEVYAFSVFKNPLVERFDSSLTAIGAIFSIAIVMLGLSAAVLGTWVERVGPRKAMATAAVCWSSGFAIGSLGVATNQLWLVYFGYGFVGGIGLGIGYISPVSTLIKWFPDRPGLATGLAIMGFGGGALIASPLSESLLGTYAAAAGGRDRPRLPDPRRPLPGHDVAGRLRHPGARRRLDARGLYATDGGDRKVDADDGQRDRGDAIRTPQFWLLWACCSATSPRASGSSSRPRR